MDFRTFASKWVISLDAVKRNIRDTNKTVLMMSKILLNQRYKTVRDQTRYNYPGKNMYSDTLFGMIKEKYVNPCDQFVFKNKGLGYVTPME